MGQRPIVAAEKLRFSLLVLWPSWSKEECLSVARVLGQHGLPYLKMASYIFIPSLTHPTISYKLSSAWKTQQPPATSRLHVRNAWSVEMPLGGRGTQGTQVTPGHPDVDSWRRPAAAVFGEGRSPTIFIALFTIFLVGNLQLFHFGDSEKAVDLTPQMGQDICPSSLEFGPHFDLSWSWSNRVLQPNPNLRF